MPFRWIPSTELWIGMALSQMMWNAHQTTSYPINWQRNIFIFTVFSLGFSLNVSFWRIYSRITLFFCCVRSVSKWYASSQRKARFVCFRIIGKYYHQGNTSLGTQLQSSFLYSCYYHSLSFNFMFTFEYWHDSEVYLCLAFFHSIISTLWI